MTDDDSEGEPAEEVSDDEPILGAHIVTNSKEPSIDDDVEVDTLSDDE